MAQHTENEAPIREQPKPPVSNDEQENNEDADRKLDEALEMTFPASDPVSI